MSIYHHENLDETLLEKGIEMISQESINSFSLRKLAIKCNVSHNALYRHFASKEDFIKVCRAKVTEVFMEYLQESINGKSYDDFHILNDFGVGYINFFKNNPNYYHFIYDEETGCKIVLSLDYVADNYPPFELFRSICEHLTRKANLPKEIGLARLIRCWGIVQGISSLITSKNITFLDNWDFLLPAIFEGK